MPTDPTLIAALRDATAETLTMDARIATQPEVRLNAWYEPDVALVTVTLPDVTLRRLAALALAVARMQERGFGVDAAWFGPDDPPVWFDTNTRPDEHSDVTTLPAALSALLEQAP